VIETSGPPFEYPSAYTLRKRFPVSQSLHRLFTHKTLPNQNTHQLASEIRIVPLERMELDAIRAVVSVLFAFMKKLRTG